MTSWKAYHISVCLCGKKLYSFGKVNLVLISFLSHNIQFIKINEVTLMGMRHIYFYIRKHGFKRLRLLEFYLISLYKFIFL